MEPHVQPRRPNRGAQVFRQLIGKERGAQADAARRLGVTPDVVGRLLTEERIPGLALSVKIRDAFGIDPALWTQDPSPEDSAKGAA